MQSKENVLLITGATKGIGRAVADIAAQQGWHVVGIARSPDPTFPGLLKTVDLMNPQARTKIFNEIINEFSVTRLVNNAGINRIKPFEDVTRDDYDTIMSLNVAVPYELTQLVLPAMKSSHFGRIVNIASRSLLGRSGSSVYATAKAAIVGLTRTLSLECAPYGITVNAISPGPIATEMFFSNNPPDSPVTKSIVDAIPMKRMGSALDVAAAASFFLSDAAAFTTGQNLFVCGGSSVGRAAF